MNALLIKSLNLGVIDSALSWLIGAITTLLMWIVEWTLDLVMELLAGLLYSLGMTLLDFVDFFQAFFNALCGIGSYWDAAGTKYTNQDPILSLISNETVLQVFLALSIVAVIMLILTTVIAMIRTEYTTEGAKNTKGNIIGTALKSLAMFFIVPVSCVFGILLCSGVLKAVYNATSGGEGTTAGGMVWYASSYNANRLRVKGTDGTWSLTVSDMIRGEMLKDFGVTSTTENQEQVAVIIDNAFKRGNVEITVGWLQFKALDAGGSFTDVVNGRIDTYFRYTYRSIPLTEEYYSIPKMNFIVMFLGGGMALYIMFIAAFGLIIRLYKCAILFMISAPITALTPLDGGSAFKNWRKLMIGAVASAFAIVVAFNLVFLLIPIMSEINIFNPAGGVFNALNSWNRLVNLMFVLVGLYSIKETSKWVAGMLGIEDPLAAGTEISGKVMGTVGKFGAAAGGLMVAGVGKAMTAKAAGKANNDAKLLSEVMDGKPVMKKAKDEKGKTIMEEVKDESGNVVLGKNGKPKMKAKEVPMTAEELRESMTKNENRTKAWAGMASGAAGLTRGVVGKAVQKRFEKFDDFMGGTKVFGGTDDHGNKVGLGGLVNKKLEGKGGVFDRIDDIQTEIGSRFYGNDSGLESKMDNGVKKYYKNGAEIDENTYNNEMQEFNNRRMRGAKGDTDAGALLAQIESSESHMEKVSKLMEQASGELATLLEDLIKKFQIMGSAAYNGGKLTNYGKDTLGADLTRVSELTGGKLTIQELAKGLSGHDGMSAEDYAKNRKAELDTTKMDFENFKAANINMGGVHIEMMTDSLKDALHSALSGMHIEGPDLSSQIKAIENQLKQEFDKQQAELKKEREKINQLAVAIAKYGKRLNPGK